MIRVWLFLHYLGTAAWIGGALAAMIMGFAARGADPAGLSAVVRGQARVQNRLVAPGALAVVVSGLVLSLRLYGPAAARPPGLWLLAMQVTGLAGALLVLFVGVPTATRLGRLADDAAGPGVAALRRRQAIVSSIAGGLAVLGLATILLR